MIPGWVRNWFRTSSTTRWAARPTAKISRPANMNTTEAPMITPTRTFGLSTDRLKVLAAAALSLSLTVVSNAPNRAVAARTAVGIAMPLAIAVVVVGPGRSVAGRGASGEERRTCQRSLVSAGRAARGRAVRDRAKEKKAI